MVADFVRDYPAIPHGTVLTDAAIMILRDGRGESTTQQALATALDALTVPRVAVLTETHAASSFTDGGGATGTKTMTGSIPAGAVLLGSKVVVTAGFAGNVSATLIIGDGSDTDRYMTGTPSVFATAANGIETGVPSGAKLILTANQPVLTVAGSSDFTLVLAGGGSMVVSLYYIATV